MYLDYFGLDKDPFTISPDPSFLYPSPLHRQALAHLKYGLKREGGFILLTGEVGTGKTTLTRLFLQELPGNIRVAYILNARLGEKDILSVITRELGMPTNPYRTSAREYIDFLNKDLLVAHAAGKKTLLVIEESQNLDPSVLEMLRLLTNLETDTTKLLHILLVAQPELLDTLAKPELRQLNQRVVSRYHLQPLSLTETLNYLRHRMQRAGSSRPVFDRASTAEIHRVSGGIPRLINLISERSLLGAYASNEVGVTKKVVKKAATEVLGQERKSEQKFTVKISPALIVACSILIILAVGIWLVPPSEDDSDLNGLASEPTRLVRGPQSGDRNGIVESRDNSLGAAGLVEDGGTETSSPARVNDLLQNRGDEPFPVVVRPSNAYTQLLSEWSIDRSAAREDDLCQIALEEGLRCHLDDGLLMAQLELNSVGGIVRLQQNDDSVSTYLLRPSGDGQYRLSNASGELLLSNADFENAWDGSLLQLWAPPPGYSDSLRVGVKNPQVVDWVQRQIALLDSSYEQVITGGVYSIAISDQVRRFQMEYGLSPDGVLGRETVMAMNELIGNLSSDAGEI